MPFSYNLLTGQSNHKYCKHWKNQKYSSSSSTAQPAQPVICKQVKHLCLLLFIFQLFRECHHIFILLNIPNLTTDTVNSFNLHK